jgi:hypothetical protein
MIGMEEIRDVLAGSEEDKWTYMLCIFCSYFAPLIEDDETEREFVEAIQRNLRAARQAYAAAMPTEGSA